MTVTMPLHKGSTIRYRIQPIGTQYSEGPRWGINTLPLLVLCGWGPGRASGTSCYDHFRACPVVSCYGVFAAYRVGGRDGRISPI